jgi:hypothetical protein
MYRGMGCTGRQSGTSDKKGTTTTKDRSASGSFAAEAPVGSRCRCGTGEPIRGADVSGASGRHTPLDFRRYTPGLTMRATATAASAKRQRGGGSHVSNRDGPRSTCAIAARRRRQPRRTRLRRRRQTRARTCATAQIDHAARTRCRRPARRSAGALDRGTHQRARPREHVHDACMRDCA